MTALIIVGCVLGYLGFGVLVVGVCSRTDLADLGGIEDEPFVAAWLLMFWPWVLLLGVLVLLCWSLGKRAGTGIRWIATVKR